MFLKQLAIRRKDAWEDPKRPLVGSVWLENQAGTELKINLSEDAATRIVELCAEGIVEASVAIAAGLASDGITKKE